MKKIFTIASCFASSLLASQAPVDTSAQQHTHTITITMNFEASPQSAEQWDALQAQFNGFLTKARAADENDTIKATTKGLLDEIEQAFETFPAYCKQHNIAGNCGMSFSMTTPEDTTAN